MNRVVGRAIGTLAVPVLAAAGMSACTVVKQPLGCTVSATPGKVLTKKTETITVRTAPGASVTSSVRYLGTKGYVRYFRANARGVAQTLYASGSGPGRVSVTILVVRGSSFRTCATSWVTVKAAAPHPKPIPKPIPKPQPVPAPVPVPVPVPVPGPATTVCDDQLYPANPKLLTDGSYARPQQVLNVQAKGLACEFTLQLTKEAAAADPSPATFQSGDLGFVCARAGLRGTPGTHYSCLVQIAPQASITFDIVPMPLVACPGPLNPGLNIWVANTTCGTADAVINVPRAPQGGGDGFVSGGYVCAEPFNPTTGWDVLHHRCYTSDYLHAIFYQAKSTPVRP